jgi:pimeloyl-ACP methyl ester carboxylesterase
MVHILAPAGKAAFAIVDPTMLPYDEAGSGDAVVLLHAGVADRTMWHEHLDGLAEAGFRVLAVDMPGFGEAPIRSGPQAPWEDVLQTLQELDVPDAALVGNSFGAAVALRVAAVAPAAVFALALISPPPLALEPSPALSQAWGAENAALERGDIEGAVAAVVDAWTLPGAAPALRDRIAAMQRRAFALQAGAGDVQEAPDPLERHPGVLGLLQVPTLAAAGEYDMPDFKRGAEELASTLPRCQLVIIEGAGHLAPLEMPVTFRDLLITFLREDRDGICAAER